MRGFKGEEEDVVADLKVEQYHNNREESRFKDVRGHTRSNVGNTLGSPPTVVPTKNRRSDFSIEPNNIFWPYRRKTDRVTCSKACFPSVGFQFIVILPVKLKINSRLHGRWVC